MTEDTEGKSGGKYVKVIEATELPLESDGALLKSTLHAKYPGATGLEYKDAAGKFTTIAVKNNKVLLPPSEEDILFYVVEGQGKEPFAEPLKQDKVKLWSLMSHKGDGFLAAVHHTFRHDNLEGNGLLSDSKNASFEWEIKRNSTSSPDKQDGVTLKWTVKEKYITTSSDSLGVYMDKWDPSEKLQQTFTMERWPMSTRVANAGSYVRFKVPNTGNNYLGCSGNGVVSVMEQKEPTNSHFENFFPNPGTLFFLYDLGK